MTARKMASPAQTLTVGSEADWMMYRMIGVRRRDLDGASPLELGEHLRALERRLLRERNKGLARHWSYDLNRHMVLKAVRDMVVAQLETRRRRGGA